MSKEKPAPDNSSKKGKSLESQLTKEQKKVWKSIKRGFEELRLEEQGKLKFRPLQEVLDEL